MTVAAGRQIKPRHHEITITRTVDGPPGKVFEAWLRPDHLALTRGWEDERGEAARERPVTVDFAGTGGRTRVVFRIGGFESIEERDSEIEGWNECLDRLVGRRS